MQVLLIGDDSDSSHWLAGRLKAAGFAPKQVASTELALCDGLANHARAIILDIASHGPSGSELVRPLRGAGVDKPLMVLSARGNWRDKVESLDGGADDYMVKPVRSEEVAARLRAILRRNAGSANERLEAGDIALDLKAQCAWQGGRDLDLTRREFRLLRLLLLSSDHLVLRRDLVGQLHNKGELATDNALEVLINRLRRKIGKDRIKTVRGMGYRINPAYLGGYRESVTHNPCASPNQEID